LKQFNYLQVVANELGTSRAGIPPALKKYIKQIKVTSTNI